MNETGFPQAVLMCHAPIVIPQVAGARAPLCAASSKAMTVAAEFLVSHHPEGIVLLSPHTARYRNAYGMAEGNRVWGNFEAFGRPDIGSEFDSDRHLQTQIESLAQEHGVDVKPIPSGPLDHGALVPMHFLKEAGYQGKIIVVGFPQETSLEKNKLMGMILQKSISKTKSHWALLASGDMSHRLIPGAPAGFHPHAARFDRLVVKCVETGELEHISSINGDLRESAAEDVADSLEIACAALHGGNSGNKILSYEGPFGVGYLVAILHDEKGVAP
jgi:aromatic ring-opening dioxygenase LigB subunit